MKTKVPSTSKESQIEDLKAEYTFDYAKAKTNRFADKVSTRSIAVLLDPDVADVFRDAQAVNTVLRALLTTMPARSARKKR